MEQYGKRLKTSKKTKSVNQTKKRKKVDIVVEKSFSSTNTVEEDGTECLFLE